MMMTQKNTKTLIKKFGILALILTLAISMLAGCAGKTEEPAAAETNPSEQTQATTQEESTVSSDPYVIAIIQPMDHPSLNEIRDTIVSELSALGLDDQIEIKLENANGDGSMLPTIMQNLLAENVDMLVPIATPTAQAAMAATDSVPIVFSAVSNPVEAGVVTAFDQTTGNITGVSNAIAIEDIFALAKILTPDAKTFGFVYNTSEVNSATGIERAKAYCDANDLSYKEATITGTADIQQAVSSLIGEVDALFTPNDNTVASAMATYMQAAMSGSLPTYVGADSMVKDGAFATVGIDYTVLGRQTAQMIARIIGGETIAENHVEQISEYSKMINIGTANTLGLEIPEDTLKDFLIFGE
jgi:putative ABC transport system substrate-binding protein